ncbi:hypothetical protein HYALB_00005744 [Hymenoscyphus albidus]|uniref:Uncharacterized protein n=1 Tax=Hymenoscyphus albidus TaxID=595503 RepID=A0A9N9Q6E4_9HELO|nr:hypothetical protein HYALB_00005744 [Hymenoscyphus albidus]
MSVDFFAPGSAALVSLRLSPLLAATAFITGAIDQQNSWSNLAKSIPHGSRPKHAPDWLYDHVWRLIPVCAVTYPLTILLLGLNLFLGPMSKEAWRWYGTGFVLFVGHCFPYRKARRIRCALWRRGLDGEEAFESLRTFTDFHGMRIVFYDLPAWAVVFVGVISHFT